MSFENEISTKGKDSPPEHYYGDIVRKLFLAGGVLMLLSYAFFYDLIKLPQIVTVVGAILLAFLAGLQNPRQIWLNVFNTLVSGVSCFIFASAGIQHYAQAQEFNAWFFWFNQGLALLFLFATYFSSKTIRAKLIGKV